MVWGVIECLLTTHKWSDIKRNLRPGWFGLGPYYDTTLGMYCIELLPV